MEKTCIISLEETELISLTVSEILIKACLIF